MLKQIKIKKLNQKRETGVVVVEAIIAIAIISIAFAALLEVGASSLRSSASLEKKEKALLLAKEFVEGTRSFRDGTNWPVDGVGLVETGGGYPYYLAVSVGAWSLFPGVEITGIFTRKIIFDRVSRDPTTGNIENPYNALNDDDNTRKITVIIAWEGGSLQLVTYLTNWK